MRQMTIAGDSAGGNLLFNVLSHVLHPLPDVPKLDLSSPFKAAVAISPLVSFNVDGPSYKANEHSDVLVSGAPSTALYGALMSCRTEPSYTMPLWIPWVAKNRPITPSQHEPRQRGGLVSTMSCKTFYCGAGPKKSFATRLQTLATQLERSTRTRPQ